MKAYQWPFDQTILQLCLLRVDLGTRQYTYLAAISNHLTFPAPAHLTARLVLITAVALPTASLHLSRVLVKHGAEASEVLECNWEDLMMGKY